MPPEGTRPRSGLGRAAWSRSDAPRNETGLGDTVAIVDSITGTCCTFLSWQTERNGRDECDGRGAAAQPPRSTAPKATGCTFHSLSC